MAPRTARAAPTSRSASPHPASRVPWWAALLLAGLSHVLLRQTAGESVPAWPALLDGVSSGSHPGQSLAAWLQYLVPALCLAAAASAWAKQRRRAPREAGSSLSLSGLRRLRPIEFNRLVSQGFRRMGYHVVESGLTGARADGAVDIELRKDRQAFLVHCKHWKTAKIEAAAVRDFHALMTDRRVAGGFMVTTGRFSREARQYARGIQLNLVDGHLLRTMLDESRPRAADVASPSDTVPRDPPKPVEWSPESVLVPLPAGASVAIAQGEAIELAGDDWPGVEAPAAPPLSSPSCPRCNGSMALRTAREGRHAGRGFWGCTQSRHCKGVRPLV